MKIISKPDVSNWTYRHTCDKCDAQLEVESVDLHHTHYQGDFRDPSYDSYSANCPVCSQPFTVLLNKIPKLVQVEVKNRTPKSYSYLDR